MNSKSLVRVLGALLFLVFLCPDAALAGGGGGGGGVQAVSVPWLTFVWLRPLAVMLAAVLIARHCHRDGKGWDLAGALLFVAFPWEAIVGASADATFQYATAYLATPIVRATGVDVSLQMAAGLPTLVSDTVHVHVNALCAGFRVLLHATTLGVVVAALVLRRSMYRWHFIALVPLSALGANILRIAVSAHAAQSWAWDTESWALAHDAIGYGTFLLLFASLGLAASRLASTSLADVTPMRPHPAQ